MGSSASFTHFMRKHIVSICLVGSFFCTALAQADEVRRSYLAQQRAALRVSPVQVSGAQPVSVEEAVRLALTNNAKYGAHEEARRAADAQLSEAQARFWPVFDYEYLTGPAPGDVSDALGSIGSGDLAWAHRGKLGFGLPVYSFGKLSVLERLATQGLAKADFDQKQEAATLVSQVRQLYYGLQLGEGVAEVLLEAIDALTARIDEDAEDKKVAPLERLKLQLFRGELEKRLAEARSKQSVGVHALRVQLGLPVGESVRLASARLRRIAQPLPKLDAAIEQALRQRADANLLDVGIEAKRLEYALEKKKRLPDLGVGGFIELGRTVGTVDGVTLDDDFNDPFNFTRGGLGLQLKGRFDPHGSSARVRKKRHEYYQVRMQRDIAREGISLKVREAYAEARTARTQVERAEEGAAVARRMLFLTKSNQELGVGESEDYIEALKQVLLTRGQVQEALFEYNSARAKLDEQLGRVDCVGVQCE